MNFCLKTEKQKKENNRTGDVASPDWMIPIRVDRGCEPLDLFNFYGSDLKIPIRENKQDVTVRFRSDGPGSRVFRGGGRNCSGDHGTAATCSARAFQRKQREGERGFVTLEERRLRRSRWRVGWRRGALVLLQFLAGVEEGGGRVGSMTCASI